MAKCVLAKEENIDTLDQITIEARKGIIGLQIYSDGGFAKGLGAAAIVVQAVRQTEAGMQAELLGARGAIIHGARTAFQTEVAALEMATQFAETISS